MQWLQLMPGRAAGSRRRLGDRRGAVAMLFAISVVPLAMAVGLASDYSVYVKVQSQLNLAADTAAMQAVRVASEVSDTNADGTIKSASAYQADVQTAGQQAGQQWFQAQMGNLVNGSVPAGNVAVTVAYNATGTNRFTANVSYTGTVPTNFGGLFHVPSFNIGNGSGSTAVISTTFVEVLMLLDNSSSMLTPSTATDIARLEDATPCSTVGIDVRHTMYAVNENPKRATPGYWWNWNYTGYSYNNTQGSSNNPPPASLVNGNCDSAYTGDSTACFYVPTLQYINKSNTLLCTNGGGLYSRPLNQSKYNYYAQAPCAFACHTDSSGAGNDYYGLAKSLTPPIKLRLDVVQGAVASVIATLQARQQPNQFSVGVYAFNDSLSAVWPTSGEASTDLVKAQSQTQAMTTPVTTLKSDGTPNGNTDFPDSLRSLNQKVTNAGNGTTSAAPLKNLFIITDGLNDPISTTNQVGTMTSASSEQLCSLFWAKGFNVYVLYTPYLPLPSDKYKNEVMSYTEPTQAGSTAQTVAALQACARYPSHFYVASDPAAINTAMQTMLAAALNSPGRVSN
jgi:Flp pilus assembly protein TadG